MKSSMRQSISNKAPLASQQGHGQTNSKNTLLGVNVDMLMDSMNTNQGKCEDASRAIKGSLSSSSSGCSSASFTTTAADRLADHPHTSKSSKLNPVISANSNSNSNSNSSSSRKRVNKDNVFVSGNSLGASHKRLVEGEKMKGELRFSSTLDSSKGSRTSKRRSREDCEDPERKMMNSANMRKHRVNDSKVNHPTAHHPADRNMSEFSAFALRVSLSKKLEDKEAAARGLKRSSTMKISKQPADEPKAAHCCCCLASRTPTYCLPTSTRKQIDQAIHSMRRPLEPADSLRWRRTTIVGRQPPIQQQQQHHYQVAGKCQGRRQQVTGGETEKKEYELTGKCVFSGVQRPRARKSLPVPPPVIPLYKEMALELPLSTRDFRRSIDHCAAEGGSGGGQVKMEAKVDDPSAAGSRTKAAGEKETKINATKEQYRPTASPMEENPRRNVIFPPFPSGCPSSGMASLSDANDIGNLRFYYLDNWQELRVQDEKRAAKRESSERASAQSCCRLENEGGGQLGSDSLASSDQPDYSKREQPTVSLSRRTAGKFLERIKLTFLANFSSISQAAARPSGLSGNQSGDLEPEQQHLHLLMRDAPPHDDTATLKRQDSPARSRNAHDPQTHKTTSEDNIYSTPNFTASSNNNVNLGSSSIYDTPESNNRPSQPLSTCKSRHMSSGTLTRPTIPPPPPPPERGRARSVEAEQQQLLAHRVTRDQSLAMRAKRRTHLNLKRTSSDRDCSTFTAATSTLRLKDESVVVRHRTPEGVDKWSESELELSSLSSLISDNNDNEKIKEQEASSSRKEQEKSRKAVKWAEDALKASSRESKVCAISVAKTIRGTEKSSCQLARGETAQSEVSFNPELGKEKERISESAKHLLIKSLDSTCLSASSQEVEINSSKRSLASFASLVAAAAAAVTAVTAPATSESCIKKGHKTTVEKQEKLSKQSRQSVSTIMGSSSSSPLPLPLAVSSSSSTVTNSHPKKRTEKEQTSIKVAKCSMESASPRKLSLFKGTTCSSSSSSSKLAKDGEEVGAATAAIPETSEQTASDLHCSKPLILVKSLLFEPLQPFKIDSIYSTAQATSKQHLKDEDPLERRRKSIQDGDVFIYPSHYKDQNVCRKCLRDNRICSCNLIIDDTTTEKENDQEEEEERANFSREPIKSKDEKLVDGELSFKVRRDGCSKVEDDDERLPSGGNDKREEEVEVEAEAEGGGEEELKSVYKISIATASIDQRSNQLRLSMPKIIVSKRTSSVSSSSSPSSKSVKLSSNNFTAIESSALLSPLASNKHTSSLRNSSATTVTDPMASECTSSAEVASSSSSITSKESQMPKRSGDSRQEEQIEREEYEEEEAVEVSRSRGVEALTSPIAMIDATPFPLNLDLSSDSSSKSLINKHQAYKENQIQDTNCIPVETKVTSILIGSPTRCQVLDLQTILPRILSPDPPLNSSKSSSTNQLYQTTINDCDTQKQSVKNLTSNNRTLENIIREEKENDEQLTCNLSVGDSIKITSTSFRVASSTFQPSGQMANLSYPDYTSVIPITTTASAPVESLSSRRRKIPAKLSRQAIHEDEDDADTGVDNEIAKLTLTTEGANHIVIPTTSCQLLCSSSNGSVQRDDENSCSSSSNNDVLEYSPILTSVRDYINNINTSELQVQTTTSSSASQQSSLESSSDLQLLPSKRLQRSLGDSPPELSTSSNLLISSPLIQSHASCILNGEISPLLSLCSPSQQSPTIITSQQQQQQHITSSSLSFHTNELESPKKSIFEGASKDEILEYLADARERVPEILMAADDVMVIGENELIVVNQLEPNSPATPISIVESVEMISEQKLDGSTLVSSSETDTDSHPDQLKQHLQQMLCQQSDLIMSQFSSTDNNNTLDVSEELSVCEPSLNGLHYTSSSRNSVLDSSSTRDTSLDTPLTMSTTGDKFLANFLQTDTTFDSIEDQSMMGSCLLADDHNNNNKSQLNQEMNNLRQLSTTSALCQLETDLPHPIHKIKTSKEAQDLIINTSYATSGFVARRNSTSLDGSPASQISRECALKLMRVHQQRYSNRDSLSSQSSTPPSSTSPSSASSSASSSVSSNPTSGNCSAASTFYASSSLSCSSPLLALSRSSRSQPLPLPPPESSSCLDDNQSIIPASPLSAQKSHTTTTTTVTTTTTTTTTTLYNSQVTGRKSSELAPSLLSPLEQDDSGLGSECSGRDSKTTNSSFTQSLSDIDQNMASLKSPKPKYVSMSADKVINKMCITQDIRKISTFVGPETKSETSNETCQGNKANIVTNSYVNRNTNNQVTNSKPTFTSSANLMSRTVHGHYATMNRLNNYFMNRNPLGDKSEVIVDFQCLDCDQFIDVDQATMLHKSRELRLLRESDQKSLDSLESIIGDSREKLLTSDQLDRAYIAAMNGLPLCKSCEKKRIERKEIISEFVETELKYGRDLKIIYDEFFRPMQIAGLLGKEQINGVFLNLEELILVHCKFADRLQVAISEAHTMGDTDYNTLNIGRLFIESSEMLHAFESYCIRQGSAACLLARLAKEKELLRIFLRVSQMENTLLRRMNLAAFLMVPVQRVTKYPLLLNRLYKVTAYHHKDRELLRDAQLKVELHLEHINQQTKGVGATNKIWRRISNLSAPISNRRGLINAEDIGYIKLRKTAMDMLKWDRDETQFIHSGKLNFAPLNEFLTKQKMKPSTMRYMAAHALLIVLGKPNWKYRPDLVKSNLDSKLMTPTPGGTGIKETALLLFREKNGRFIPCREPLFLSNCVLSANCSQFNSECPASLSTMSHNLSKPASCSTSTVGSTTSTTCPSANGTSNKQMPTVNNTGQQQLTSASSNISAANKHMDVAHSKSHPPKVSELSDRKSTGSSNSDAVSMVSIKSLPEERLITMLPSSPPLLYTSRSNSLASSLPPNSLTHHLTNNSSTSSLTTKSSCSSTSSNLTIINQFMTKVNSYHNKQQQNDNNKSINSATSNQLDHTNGSHSITTNGVNHLSSMTNVANLSTTTTAVDSVLSQRQTNNNLDQTNNNKLTANVTDTSANHQPHYNHLLFHNHHQPYGDYEESFEIHERLTKESMLLRADTPLKTRYWLQMLRYHAKDLGQWRTRRNGLANIMMMMRQE